MRLDINTTQKRVFRQILEIIRSIPPLNTLRNRELDVLAILMYYNYKYRDVAENIRWRIINDTSTRKEMQQEINMTEDIFNNNISLVRRAGIIDKEGKIPSYFMIDVGDKYEVKINFKIQDNEI
jgi:hypothetical protein